MVKYIPDENFTRFRQKQFMLLVNIAVKMVQDVRQLTNLLLFVKKWMKLKKENLNYFFLIKQT
jgi:hypothetical protein